MRPTWFEEAQIIAILQEAAVGAKGRGMCLAHGIAAKG